MSIVHMQFGSPSQLYSFLHMNKRESKKYHIEAWLVSAAILDEMLSAFPEDDTVAGIPQSKSEEAGILLDDIDASLAMGTQRGKCGDRVSTVPVFVMCHFSLNCVDAIFLHKSCLQSIFSWAFD